MFGFIPKRARQRLASATRILIIPLVIVLYVAVLVHNLHEKERRSLWLQYDSEVEDKVHVRFDIVSVDVTQAQVTARMQIRLAGRIARDEFTPAVNLRFLVNAVHGQQRYEFPRGERVAPVEVVFALDGETNLYPFDTYQASLAFLAAKPGQATHPGQAPAQVRKSSPSTQAQTTSIQALTQEETKDTAANPAAPDTLVGTSELASHSLVPVAFDLSASIPGFKFEGEMVRSASEGDLTRIQLDLRRADNVIATSLGIQLVMIGLALSMLAMVLYGTIQSRESALIPLSISATLIFGLPQLRDSQPGIPPLGVFSDYISYLWAEAIVALCTIIAIWTWIARRFAKR